MKHLIKYSAIVMLFFLLGCSGVCTAQTLTPKQDGKDWGYVDSTGKWVIDAEYRTAFPFSGSSFDYEYALVEKAKMKGRTILSFQGRIINKQGDILLEDYPMNVGDYKTGDRYTTRTPYASIGQPGMIFDLKTGRYIILPVSVQAQMSDACSGRYFVVSNRDKCGIVRADSLTFLFEMIYDGIRFYKGKNYVTLLKDGKYAILDSNLKTLVDFKYKSVDFQSDGKTAKVVLDKNQLLIDLNGNVLKEITYEERLTDDHGTGLYPARVNGKWGFVNADDAWVIPATFQKVRAFAADGITMVQLADGKSTLINKKGEQIGKYKYDNYYWYYEKPGIATPMQVNNVWGYYDMHDESVVIAPVFEAAETFDAEGVARAKINGRWGLIDKTGKFFVQPVYVSISAFDDNGWAIVDNGVGLNS